MSDEPECPTCETDLLVVKNATHRGGWLCYGCDEPFGVESEPIDYDAVDKWFAIPDSRCRQAIHVDWDCIQINDSRTLQRWSPERARRSPYHRCPNCAVEHTEVRP